jgi:hypothetical protein
MKASKANTIQHKNNQDDDDESDNSNSANTTTKKDSSFTKKDDEKEDEDDNEDDEDDDEDDILFNRNNSSMRGLLNQNITFESIKALRMHKNLIDLHPVLRVACFFSFLLITFLIMAVFLLGYDQVVEKKFLNYSHQSFNNDHSSRDWSFNLTYLGSESCVRLVDIDEDGFDDIIFGVASNFYFINLYKNLKLNLYFFQLSWRV